MPPHEAFPIKHALTNCSNSVPTIQYMSSSNTSPAYRRKFLGSLAAMAASFGISASASTGVKTNYGAPKHSVPEGNVLNFGARGDGSADDSAAIQSAVNAATGSLYFPKGVFKITRTIEIDLDRVGYTAVRSEGGTQIVMAGAGPAFKFVGTHNKSADPQGFSDDVWRRQRMPMLDNIAITGEHAEAIAVEATGTMQLTITKLHVRNVLHGIHLRGNNRNITIADCHFYENKGIAIFYDDVNLHQSNITGCHISYNTGGGIVSKGGNVRNIQITGCDIESNMGRDTPPTANVLIDCSTSAWGTAEVAITGCSIQHNNSSPDSANIRILGGNEFGTPPEKKRWGNITITGNILSDVMVNVHLKDCRGVAISGNTFWEGFQHNLLLEGCSNIVMGANVLDFNLNYERKVIAKNSLRVVNCEDCTFTGLQITNVKDSAGWSLENCHRVNISNCNILDCEKVGLSLKSVTDSIVSNCIIKNSRTSGNFTPIALVESGSTLMINNLT